MSRPRRWRQPVLFAWMILIALETLCQVSIKLAAGATGAFDFTPAAFLAALRVPWLWSAIGCYVGAFLAWMTILRKSSLSSAFPTSAIVFVAVMVTSWVVFGEAVGWLKLLGSVIIVVGIVLMGSEPSSEAPGTADKARTEPGTTVKIPPE